MVQAKATFRMICAGPNVSFPSFYWIKVAEVKIEKKRKVYRSDQIVRKMSRKLISIFIPPTTFPKYTEVGFNA